MPWVRIDTAFVRHPKRLSLTLRQREIHLAALCWAGEQYTGGRIPRAALAALGARPSDAARMVEIGLWDRDPVGFRIHDWDVYNADSERGKEARDARAEQRRKWREEKRAQREAERKSTGQSGRQSTGQRPDSPADVLTRAHVPRAGDVPSRPVPSPVPPTGETGRVKGATSPAPAPGAQAPPRGGGANRGVSIHEAAASGLVGPTVARVLARRGVEIDQPGRAPPGGRPPPTEPSERTAET